MIRSQVTAESVAFHGGVMLASWIILRFLDWLNDWRRLGIECTSGTRQQFRKVLDCLLHINFRYLNSK